MGKTEERAGCIASVLFVIAIIGMFVVHLFLCYYVYKTSTFLAVVITFVLPVIAELYWLGAMLGSYGFTWVHLLFCGCCVLYLISALLSKVDGSRAEARRLRKEQKRHQALDAERAAREAAAQATNEQYNTRFTPAAAAAIANRKTIENDIAARASQSAPARQPAVIVPQQPVSTEEQLRRRAEAAERRCQELSAELQQQKGARETDILAAQIAEIERTIANNRSILPPDGLADLQQELMEKKARYFDLTKR